MNKFISLCALLLFSLPTFASIDHWTCSNDQTVLYFILDTDEGSFMMFDDKGIFIATAKFTSVEKTRSGTPFMYVELDNDVSIGVTKQGSNLVIAFINGKDVAKFICN